MTLPRSIGPYRPLHRIGAGGMGTVYFAYHPVTGKPSAVKVLSPDYANDRHYRQRFIREVEVLRRISGPYLVPLVDADTQAEVPWLAMPYVPGETLQQHVQSHGALRGENLLTFATAVALALAYIHAAGVTHRDLKHANVILAEDGPRVLDFGIAGHVDITAFTRTSMPRSGSPGWMAPEQLTRGETTPACDIFAWGILVAYAAAGSHPFGPSTAIEHRIIHAEPDLQPVPERLRPLVSRALHKDPDTRLTVTQLAEQTAGLLGPAGTVVLPTVAYTRQASPATTEETTLAHNLPWTLSAPGIDLTRTFPFARGAGWRSVPEAREFLDDATVTLSRLRETLTRANLARDDMSAARTALGDASTALAAVRKEYDQAGGADCEPATRAVEAATAAIYDILARQVAQQAGQRETRNQKSRPHRRRRVLVAAGAAAAVTLTGSVAYTLERPTHSTAQPPAAAGTHRATTSAAPATVAPSTSNPSPTDTPTTASPTPTATPVTVLGGLQFTLPASWDASQMPQDSLNFDDGMDSRYAVDLVAHDGSHTGGLAVEWAPGMTSINGGSNGTRNDNFGMFGIRFTTGGPNPSAGGTYQFDQEVREQTVTRASLMQQLTVAGEQAQAWTVHTDILPDHNHTRTAVHRVWLLPSSHYVLYDYGTLEPKRTAEIDAILKSAKLTRVEIPLDCVDAVDFLDTAAAGGSPQGDDPSQSCLDLTVNSTGSAATAADSTALDPGTMKSKTAAACLSLVSVYSVTYAAGDASYTRARRNCDFPRSR
ncbi:MULTISPECIES: serine/threonine-protein kinase [unclassified Streptomyces]|uniref:serine/threonine protein kinase n=1 Tax=unclassified Streptomyces TaxID=2593676 RepID=UPI001164771F|nr:MULTISPECIES: serine/threonine-protein kinase [unclassified Streptomyces]NMI55736.1 protein kinase [Streptomyces sp. RLA2-12]QDN65402.1 protein kinase [Streptomyces sp. S1D4-14]QDO47809.1 protein kinase [Streptomyces sp. RLB3-5]QDO58048.1 protein kinase [Streptomyces sp. RLB1-8]